MRFTILTQYYPPEIGAAQVRLAALANELKKLGHDVQVVTAMPNYPKGKIRTAYRGKLFCREEHNGIIVTRFWLYTATGKVLGKRLLNYLSFTLLSLFGLFFVPNAEILFVESPPLFLTVSARLAAKLRGQQLCIIISDLWPDSVVDAGIMQDGFLVALLRKLESWVYRGAWRICGTTKGLVQGIICKGVPPQKVLFFPNGVDVSLFHANYSKHSPKQIFQFVYAGTHGYAHGTEVILYAADRLRNRSDIQFLLVGDGSDKSRLKNLAIAMKLTNVVFQDAVPLNQIPMMLSKSYAALVTVSDGPHSVVTRSAKIFPAMAAGKAIVHSGYGEGAELIQQSQSGIVIPPGDEQALADAVLFLVENPSENALLGQNGRAFVEREYSWKIIVDNLLENLTVGTIES